MYDSAATQELSCPRCGMALRLHGALSLDRCPRCFAFDGEVVPIDAEIAIASSPIFGHLVVALEEDDRELVVSLFGKLDLASVRCLDIALRRAQTNGCESLLIDLSGLEFMDSAGLQVLLRIREQMLAIGRPLRLLRGQPSVQRLFELSGLQDLFTFED